MEKSYLTEAFKALEELNEDVFDISLSDGLEDAKDFMEEPVDDREEEIIIDPLAETEEDLEKDYLGKAILQCEICQSMIYKNPDEVVIDEELGLANVDEACPFCQSEDGFKVIGQIEEFCDDEDCKHKDKEETETEVKVDDKDAEIEDKEEEIEESIKTRRRVRTESIKESSTRDDIDANKDNKVERAKKLLKKKINDADADRDYKLKKNGLKEGKQLNETGEWSDDDEGAAWKEGLAELVKKYTSGIKEFEFDEEDIHGFDKYQGPYIDTRIGTIWSHPEGDINSFIVESSGAWYVISSREDAEDLVAGKLKPIEESCKSRKSKKSLKESDKPAATSIQDAQKWVDYDMKKYGRVSAKTNRLVKKAGFRIDKDQYGDYEVVAGTYESCNEDVQKDVYTIEINNEIYQDDFGNPYHFKSSEEAKQFIEDNELKDAKITRQYGLSEDTIKQNGKWVNKGKEGTHGKFRTKKEADAQRRAMFANGYKESIEEEYELTDTDIKRIGKTNSKNQWAFSNKDLLRLARQHKRAKMQNDERTMARIEYRLDDANFHKEASLLNNGQYDKLFKMLKEDFNKVDIETDREKMSMTADENGKVTVTTEPKNDIEEVSETDEVIAPVSDETKAEFKSSEEETEDEDTFTDVDFDEFEEKDFDELGESYLRKVYENVRGFKTTKGTISGNKLKLEGVITFKSGKQAKTDFIFEAYNATKTGKLKFIGENKQFAKGKKSFTLTGKVDGNKLVCESLNYSYVGKSADGTSKRLYGTVRK